MTGHQTAADPERVLATVLWACSSSLSRRYWVSLDTSAITRQPLSAAGIIQSWDTVCTALPVNSMELYGIGAAGSEVALQFA